MLQTISWTDDNRMCLDQDKLSNTFFFFFWVSVFVETILQPPPDPLCVKRGSGCSGVRGIRESRRGLLPAPPFSPLPLQAKFLKHLQMHLDYWGVDQTFKTQALSACCLLQIEIIYFVFWFWENCSTMGWLTLYHFRRFFFLLIDWQIYS